MNFTDWHCHILPGIDDGPSTMHEAVAMARVLRDAGFGTVLCTPHLIKGRFTASNATVRITMDSLQAELDRQQIDMRILPGREYYLDQTLLGHLKDPLPLGATPYLLIEIPYQARVEFVKSTLFRITRMGYLPMLAHPERCSLFAPQEGGSGGSFNLFRSLRRTDPNPYAGTTTRDADALLEYLKKIGCAFQCNVGSFTGRYGAAARKTAEKLREAQIYTHYGTDLHSADDSDFLSKGGLENFVDIS